MIVKELQSAPASHRRPSTRKHEAVRKPTARNAIVRDRETGAYQALVDEGELADALNGISLRLNAMELNVSILMRDDSVSRGHAAPMPSNVVPMHAAREAKEQSKAVPVSHPLPVAGNEALVLPVPEPTVVVEEAPPLKTGDAEPKFIGKVDTITNGDPANDEVLIPDMVLSDLMPIMKQEDLPYMEGLADAYQMDLVEASQILCKEYMKREVHCLQEHGQPRKEVRCDRYLAQKGIVETNPALQVWTPAEAPAFKAWSKGLFQREQEWSLAADKRRDAPLRAPAPYTKGEAAYRKKVVIHRAASERRANPAGYAHVQDIAVKLHTDGPGVTTRSQVAAIETWTWDIYQRGRKLFGMEPTLRNATERTRVELTQDISARRQATAPVDLIKGDKLTQAELVRRYQRQGIGH